MQKIMVNTDKKLFSEYLIGCFQNYRANISDAMVEEWFSGKLFGFPLFVIKSAFNHYSEDCKNKYPPQRAQIIQLCYQHTSEKINESKMKIGCIRIIGDKNCGKEILVHGHCEECYDEVRPKNFTDLKREEYLKAFYERAKTAGCISSSQIADFAKAELGLTPLGRTFLDHVEKVKIEKPKTNEELDEFFRNYEAKEPAPHNDPRNFEKTREILS